MQEDTNGSEMVAVLSDKDYQLVSKTYRKICELFYENTSNEDNLQNISVLTSLIPQIVPSKSCTNRLTIVSQMEILKAKMRNRPNVSSIIEHTLNHLKNPKYVPLDHNLLVESLNKMELFSVACTITLRYLAVLKQNHQIDWKIVIDSISQSINLSPHLSIDILNEVSSNNDQNIILISKSGVVKFIFFNYIFSTFKDKFSLYRAIKLIRLVSKVDKSTIRDKEPILSKIIETYEEYIPTISDICNKSYQEQYCREILKKNIYDESGIDFPYIWSHTEQFCEQQLTQDIIKNYRSMLKEKISGSSEAKIFSIFSNFCKYRKYFSKELLQVTPRYQESLLNFFKLCISLTENDSSTPYFINWEPLDNLLVANSNAKVGELAKYLKELRTKEVKVGAISSNMRKIFSSEKNADLMMERASKIPKSSEELEGIKQILSQKGRNTQFDSDTLKMAKEKACDSLRQAIAHESKLDINSILQTMQLSDIYLVTKVLQVVELYLMMFEDEVDNVDLKRILEIICWVEDNYRGEIIDWGSISQLLVLLCAEDQWKRHLKNLDKYCFWLLSIEKMDQNDEKLLWDTIKKHDPKLMNKKMPFIVGFLGKVTSNPQKVNFLQNHKVEFESVMNKFMINQNYETNTMMLSYFLKGWSDEEEDYDPQKYKKIFEEVIAPINNVISSHTRLIPQEYHLLESCLPFSISTKNISADIQSLIKSNGKLASYLYEEQKKKGRKVVHGQINHVNKQPAEAIHQSMLFGKKLPNIMKPNELNNIVSYISEESQSYWQMYPRFATIVTNIIDIAGHSQNEDIRSSVSQIYEKLITQVNANDNLTDDERQQLYEEIRNAFENLNKRGVYIEIERLKKVVTKIVEKQIREEIIVILNNYKVKEEQIQMKIINEQEEEEKRDFRKNKMEEKQPEPFRVSFSTVMKNQRDVENYREEIEKGRIQRSSIFVVNQSQIKEQAISVSNIDKQKEEMQVVDSQIFQIIKKVVRKELDISKFYQIYDAILEKNMNQAEKQLLGTLMVQLYHMVQNQKIISLLLDKQKTILTKEQVFELVNSHIAAFALSKRWKLVSRQYLNLSMKRVKQGFVSEGCQVASYNLVKTNDLEHFFSSQFHNIVFELVETINVEEEVSHLLNLIGMAARFPKIRVEWLSKKLHVNILKFIKMFPNSIKVTGSLCFALSALTFEENDACVSVISQTELTYQLFDSILKDPANHSIAQYSSLFIGNLSFSKCFEIHPNFNLEKVIIVLKKLLEANLATDNFTPFKHLLKAFGNMSLLKGCSAMILNKEFCSNLVLFSEKIEIITGYDEKKGKYTKLLLDLISNLAKNKDKLILMHECKITLLTTTLLQITQSQHSDLIASCIDAIDSICQDPNLEHWYVNEKKLPYILLDILKLQSEQKLIMKAIRLITNLTLHAVCIPTILKSNILGVIANVVIPQLAIHNITGQNSQYSKKIELYIVKALTRVHQVNPSLELVLKGGYLDCLVRMIEMADVNEFFLDLLFHYSPYIPNFLSKRAFSSMIKILTVKVNDKEILAKCIQSLKSILSFSYDVQEEDSLFKGIPQMYLKFISTEYTSDALFLMAYHLFRSRQFRQVLRKPDHKLQEVLNKMVKVEEYSEMCKAIVFLVYSPPIQLNLEDMSGQTQIEYYQIMKQGFKCKLYRSDGTCKEAKLDIDEQYNLRVYKFPDGEIKKKYTTNIKNIREFQLNFHRHPQLWKRSVFATEKGLFSNTAQSKNCCTIVSNSRWGYINMISIEFEMTEQKLMFHKCLSYLLAIFKL